MVKTIHIVLEDYEYEELVKAKKTKKYKTWREMVLKQCTPIYPTKKVRGR